MRQVGFQIRGAGVCSCGLSTRLVGQGAPVDFGEPAASARPVFKGTQRPSCCPRASGDSYPRSKTFGDDLRLRYFPGPANQVSDLIRRTRPWHFLNCSLQRGDALLISPATHLRQPGMRLCQQCVECDERAPEDDGGDALEVFHLISSRYGLVLTRRPMSPGPPDVSPPPVWGGGDFFVPCVALAPAVGNRA